MDLRFQHPFTLIVAGPSSSGKSVFVERLIESGIKSMDVDFRDIVWCYSVWHPTSEALSTKVRFQKGLEELSNRGDTRTPRLLVLDDLMREADTSVVDLFTRDSHHCNMSVVFITQNLFFQQKGMRDISLNAHYIVLFKNPRDMAQVGYLARQVCPTQSKFLQEAYGDATSRAHGYLVLDLKQRTPEEARYRTNIFGEWSPGFPIAYVPKKKKRQ